MKDVPNRFLFMKVGNHAGETWEQILARKNREYERTGRSFWGYGGTVCHPIRQVQPFAKLAIADLGQICMIMEPIDSHAGDEVVVAKEFSEDGKTWKPVPRGITVKGSRYALVLDEIKPGELEIPLNEFEVAIGPSKGKSAESYLQGRTDKACFVRSKSARSLGSKPEQVIRKAGYTAHLLEPFAVLLR